MLKLAVTDPDKDDGAPVAEEPFVLWIAPSTTPRTARKPSSAPYNWGSRHVVGPGGGQVHRRVGGSRTGLLWRDSQAWMGHLQRGRRGVEAGLGRGDEALEFVEPVLDQNRVRRVCIIPEHQES